MLFQEETNESQQPRVLVVEDQMNAFVLMRFYLQQLNCEVQHAATGTEALTMVREHKPHLILLDYQLVDHDGLFILKRLRELIDLSQTPVVFVTGNQDKTVKEQAFDLGAVDYINKPLDELEFSSRILNALKLREAYQRLRSQAMTDFNTGMMNRQALTELLPELTRDAPNDSSFSYFYIDIDDFHDINDSFGRELADQLIIQFSRRLKSFAPLKSWCFSMGGDEFLVVINSQYSIQRCRMLAVELITRLSLPYRIKNYLIPLTVTVGICHTKADWHHIETCFTESGYALIHAKEFHRGSYALFDEKIRQQLEMRHCISQDLEEALNSNQFYLVFQPIVQADTNQVCSHEVLLRWHHPRLGEISPGIFIPIAEQLGKMPIIGEWVLNQACKVISDFRKTNHGIHLHFHINASRQELTQVDYAQNAILAARHFNIPSRFITFEVTETYVQGNISQITENLAQLKNAGFSVALDDFGKGQSSLSSIHQLPIDCIKIDRSFISDIAHDHKRISILKFIIDLSNELKFDVVAEGVENIEQLCTLQSLNCNLIQGFLLGKPDQNIKVPLPGSMEHSDNMLNSA